MKILVIAGLADSLINFRGPLLAAFQDKGLEVHVAAPDLPEYNSMRLQLQGLGLVVHNVPMRRTSTNPAIDFLTMLQLWLLMRRIRPAYFLGYTIKPVIYGNLAAWLAGVPHRFSLITGLGYAFQGQANERVYLLGLVQYLYGLALRHTHKVFFQNPDDQTLFLSLGLLDKDKPSCVVNGSGVDLEYFAMTPLPAKPHFLLIARLLGGKGVREYAQAAHRIRTVFPQIQFSLVGWFDENPDTIFQSELDSWVQAGTLSFLGHLSDVRPALASCNVFVLPSYREGTPRTVLEAMSMGRAIITTDAPGCRETVVNGENGFLVPVKSVDALVDAMTLFINDPTLTFRMGQYSRGLAEDKYDVHKVNAVMLKEMGL